jgi:hypothetical protein
MMLTRSATRYRLRSATARGRMIQALQQDRAERRLSKKLSKLSGFKKGLRRFISQHAQIYTKHIKSSRLAGFVPTIVEKVVRETPSHVTERLCNDYDCAVWIFNFCIRIDKAHRSIYGKPIAPQTDEMDFIRRVVRSCRA